MYRSNVTLLALALVACGATATYASHVKVEVPLSRADSAPAWQDTGNSTHVSRDPIRLAHDFRVGPPPRPYYYHQGHHPRRYYRYHRVPRPTHYYRAPHLHYGPGWYGDSHGGISIGGPHASFWFTF